VASGAPRELMGALAGDIVEVEGDALREARRALEALPFVVSVAQLGTRLRVLTDSPDPAPALQRALDAAGVGATAHAAAPSLADVFVSATRGRGVAA
jgi:ABC-2 type transport system ATP-binding protein